jgi:tetratricopeptide (TPR) repeat protein
VADAYFDLSKVYSRVGRWADAETAQRRAMTIYVNALGPAHSNHAGALAGLCEIHLHAGRVAEAEAECREALAIRQRALGPRTLGVINPLMLLGDMRTQRGDLPAADSLYSAALSIIQEHIGGAPHAYEYLYPRIAALRDLQHRPEEAEDLRRKAGGKPIRPLDF